MFEKHKSSERIYQELTPHTLCEVSDEDLPFNFDQYLHDTSEQKDASLFLGFYSKKGIGIALKKYGILKTLNNFGFNDLILTIDLSNQNIHKLFIYNQNEDDSNLLICLILRRKSLILKPVFISEIQTAKYEVLYVEWCYLQNPYVPFTNERPQLPGQEYPGLGIGKIVAEILVFVCRRLNLDGILNIPKYFHNAIMYSSFKYSFINPELEGKFRAISRDLLKNNRLAELSWKIHSNKVIENQKEFKWFVSEQLLPLNIDLAKYFSYPEYLNKVEQEMGKSQYNYLE
jgi:hypothetical protein